MTIVSLQGLVTCYLEWHREFLMLQAKFELSMTFHSSL